MKVKMLKDSKYSSNGVNCVELKAGDIVDDLPQNIADAWLSNGSCIEAGKKELKPVDNKMLDLVDEKKEVTKATKSKKSNKK